MDFRVGFGYDVHRLVPGRRFILGGVEIEYALGLLGHSDADVLLHSICDAILGAAGLGDIGNHFPDTDERFKGISSMLLLKEVAKKALEAGFQINNVDATVVAQAPRLSPFMEKMRENVAACIGTDKSRVNIKATTTEGLGFTGEKQGIASYCVATVISL